MDAWRLTVDSDQGLQTSKWRSLRFSLVSIGGCLGGPFAPLGGTFGVPWETFGLLSGSLWSHLDVLGLPLGCFWGPLGVTLRTLGGPSGCPRALGCSRGAQKRIKGCSLLPSCENLAVRMVVLRCVFDDFHRKHASRVGERPIQLLGAHLGVSKRLLGARTV